MSIFTSDPSFAQRELVLVMAGQSPGHRRFRGPFSSKKLQRVSFATVSQSQTQADINLSEYQAVDVTTST